MKLSIKEKYMVYKLARKQYKRDCQYIVACVNSNN